jgi:hypothetical protein
VLQPQQSAQDIRAGAARDRNATVDFDPAIDAVDEKLLPELASGAALVDAGKPASTRICYGGGASRLHVSDLEDTPGRDTQCATLGEAIERLRFDEAAALLRGLLRAS